MRIQQSLHLQKNSSCILFPCQINMLWLGPMQCNGHVYIEAGHFQCAAQFQILAQCCHQLSDCSPLIGPHNPRGVLIGWRVLGWRGAESYTDCSQSYADCSSFLHCDTPGHGHVTSGGQSRKQKPRRWCSLRHSQDGSSRPAPWDRPDPGKCSRLHSDNGICDTKSANFTTSPFHHPISKYKSTAHVLS